MADAEHLAAGAHYFIKRGIGQTKEVDKWHTPAVAAVSHNPLTVEADPSAQTAGSEQPKHDPLQVVPSTTVEVGYLWRPADPPERTCHLCKKPGHQRKDCPEGLKCRSCGETGHRRAECPQAMDENCFHCGKPGHKKQHCPERKPKSKKSEVNCFNCGQPGHSEYQCEHNCYNCLHLFGEDPDRPRHYKSECAHPLPSALTMPTPPAPESASSPNQTQPVEGQEVGAKDLKAHEASGSAAKDSALPESERPESEKRQPEEIQPEEPESEDPAPPQRQLHPPPMNGHLDVELHTVTNEYHITSLELRLRASYKLEEFSALGTSKKGITEASVRITALNFASQIVVAEVDIANPALQTEVSAPTFKHLEESLLASAGSRLMRVAVMLDPRHLLGTGFYSERKFGPVDNVVQAMRKTVQQPLEKNKHYVNVHVYFITYGEASSVSDRFAAINASLNAQKQQSPVPRLWWKGGRVMPQLNSPHMRAPDDRPARPVVARLGFDTTEELLTSFFYGAVGELEAIKPHLFKPTVCSLIQFTEGDPNTLLCSLQLTAEIGSIPMDSHIAVRFGGSNAEDKYDWSGKVVRAEVFANTLRVEAFIHRPRDKSKQPYTKPVFTSDHLLQAQAYKTDFDTIRQALHEHQGVAVHVSINSPKSDLEREINTIRMAHLHASSLKPELDMIKANDWSEGDALLEGEASSESDAPMRNYYSVDVEKHGQAAVDKAIEDACGFLDLSESQRQAFKKMERLPRGSLFVQGTGGTGKTEVAIAVVLYHYILESQTDVPGRVLFLGHINKQLNDFTRRCADTLLGYYTEQKQSDPEIPLRYPLVCRVHNRQTEKAVYMYEANEQRALKREQMFPGDASQDQDAGDDVQDEDPGDEVQDEDPGDRDTVFADVLCELYLRRLADQADSKYYDRRLEYPEHSEGQHILNLAGVAMAGGERHPIAEYADQGTAVAFRDLLARSASGGHWTETDTQELSSLATLLQKQLAQLCDLRAMTYHLFSEPRNHQHSQARTVLHDEAGKTSERQTLHGLVWSVPYQTGTRELGPGGVKFETGSRPCHLFFGDTFQPPPSQAVRAETAQPFADQKLVPLFTKGLLGSHAAVYLHTQYRFTGEICDLVNTLLPVPYLITSPAVEQRSSVANTRAYFNEIFGKDTSCLWLGTSGTATVNPFTQSKSNETCVDRAMYCVDAALRHGMPGEDIGITTPYNAQLTVLHAARFALIRSYEADEDPSMRLLAKKAKELQIFTVDSLQGQQLRSLLIVDTTVSDGLGFFDDRRFTMAVTRAMAGLIIIGNDKLMRAHYAEGAHRYQDSAYYRALSFCKGKSPTWYIDTDKKECAMLMTAPFDLRDAVSTAFSGNTESEVKPLSLSEEEEYTPPVPHWARERMLADGNGLGADGFNDGGVASDVQDGSAEHGGGGVDGGGWGAPQGGDNASWNVSQGGGEWTSSGLETSEEKPDIRNDKPSTYAQSIVPNSLQRTLQQSRTEHEQKANDEQERICMEYAVNLSLIESQRRDGGASGSDIGEQLDLDNSEEESITDGADYRDEEDEDGEELEFDEYD